MTKAKMKANIIRLFDEIWPAMDRAAVHRDECITVIDQILSAFATYGHNKDQLLSALASIRGIGLVIASGLIFVAWPDKCVPFDKYTTGWALQNNIIADNRIRQNYTAYSNAITNYVKRSRHLRTVLDFVREAEGCQFPFSPE